MRVLAIANQKGGVGKTTVAVNLGAGLARQGRKVLIVDLDSQSNATQILYRRLAEDEPGMCEMLLDEGDLAAIVQPTKEPNLFLAPAGESLANADLNLAAMMGRELFLRNILQPLRTQGYDYVIIDNGPYLGLLTVNALVAADYAIVPVSCEFLPLLGLKYLLETIDKVKRKLHAELAILGYVITMYDRREAITFQVEQTLIDQFGDAVFGTRIRINTKQKSAPSRAQTIFAYEASKNGKGTTDFDMLTREVLARVEGGVIP
jgi:chromosome partitioning protein